MTARTDEPDGEGLDELLRRARAGDGPAEGDLFGRLHARILGLAKRRIRSEETARDIAQEAMATALTRYRDAVMPRGLLPWMFTILHHKIGNHLKRRRVEREHVDPREWSWDTVGVSPEGEIRAIDLRLALTRALGSASASCRKIFRLLLEEAGRREILAAFPGEPAGTIDSRISRCRRKLIEALESAEAGQRGPEGAAGRSPDRGDRDR